MSKFAIKNGIFLTMDERQPVLRGTMVVRDGVIESIGEADASALEGCEIIDGTHRLYMPGLVNTHSHLAMSLLRGYADDLALQVWLEEKMWPNEAKFTENDVNWASQLSMLEMLKSGTTCFVDMYDFMHVVARNAETAGMRAVLTRGMIGLVPPEQQRAKLAEARDFAKAWHNRAEGRIRAMISPHAAYTCPPDFIEQSVALAEELDLPIHTHMSETLREVEDNVREYGARPVAHLERLGVFSRPCLVAHAVHLNDDEIAILARHDVRVSHNPGSNLKLASGIARVPDLIRAGVKVSLGTDSSASNNNLDMFEEIRLAALLHKGVSGDPTAVPASTALHMGTLGGAESLWLERVGALKPGWKADFIALDIDQPHYYPHTDFVSHVVYSASSKDVTDVWVDGRRLLENGEPTTLDEEKIKREFALCYQRLMG